MKVAWTIAASDSSSGAGIQADLATFAHFKVHGCSIIT
ncbi:MAG TPA: bifunctional hydroxymethylpyrimidine kinase/phosphomethylpyrimidine kinase, partial [Burkholderiales bacterium]|nr:bifunctional hydroxymethylpyrimidine kinase/phosphomethylpyrimidine kinase [Burkholderiales bacterium]